MTDYSLTTDEWDRRIIEYIENRPNLAYAEGHVYSGAGQGDVFVISEIELIECPECGELTGYQKGRTSCCGSVEIGGGA